MPAEQKQNLKTAEGGNDSARLHRLVLVAQTILAVRFNCVTNTSCASGALWSTIAEIFLTGFRREHLFS